jgi:hypothetical protein
MFEAGAALRAGREEMGDELASVDSERVESI